MRLAVIALALPLMLTAMGLAALLALLQPGPYLVLLPVNAKDYLYLRPKYFQRDAGIWAVELALEPLLRTAWSSRRCLPAPTGDTL
jgi:hypothetical protein